MNKRRKFIGTAIGTAVAATFIPANLYAQDVKNKQLAPIKPKRLKKGDTIGIIAPGYTISNESLEKAKSTLIEMGFIPFYTDRIIGNYGYFSNTDEERARDLDEMFANPKVSGILCARGGYGCTRILDKIDYKNIAANPKVIIGFSDITSLHQAIHKETGLITFHGPVGTTLDDEYSQKLLKDVVMHPKNKLVITNSPLTEKQKEDSEYERYVITSGKPAGILVGGSLTLINALIGTAHEIDFTNKIVCIEDVEEAPYRIDRLLTQLIEGKTFTKAAGIVFGVSAGCNSSSNPKSFSLKEVIIDRIKPLGIPAVHGMSFGHISNNFTFPIGIRVKLNTNKMTLKLLEPAVL